MKKEGYSSLPEISKLRIERNHKSPFEHLVPQAGVPWSTADFLIESSRAVLHHGPLSLDEAVHLCPLPKQHAEKVMRGIGELNPEHNGKKSAAAQVWDELSRDAVFAQWMHPALHVVDPADYEKYAQHAQSLYLRFTNQADNSSPIAALGKGNESENMRRARNHELIDASDTYALSAVVWGARSEVSKHCPVAGHAMRAGKRAEFASAPDDKQPYLQALHEQYTCAIDVLVGSSQRLARDMVLGMRARRNYSHEDMFADAQFGLRRAAELYDASMGYEFSTFATKWIRQAVGRGYERTTKADKQPVRLDALAHTPEGEELLAIAEPSYVEIEDIGASGAIASMLAYSHTTPLMREGSIAIIRDVLSAIQAEPDGTHMQEIYEQLAGKYEKKPTAIAALAQRFFKSVRENSNPSAVRHEIRIATS
jgi:hypothetical protein